jgi:aspartate/methionine/tyrosine aminotransferase
MRDTLTARTRMDAVQAPIIPIFNRLIREVPGTISLGQGVVHYGPPPAALQAVQDALGAAATHQYQEGAGLPALVDAIVRKLALENGTDVGRGAEVMVTAGANMAFMHAVLATTTPGDEVLIPVPFYFNHEWRLRWRAAVPCRSRPIRATSCPSRL